MDEPFKILAICISCDDEEKLDFDRYTLHILQESPGITWYHIYIEKDPTIEDVFDDEGYSTLNRLKTLKTNSIFIETDVPYNYLDELLRNNNEVEAIVYSSHSGGSYLGREINPLLPTAKFAELIQEYFKDKSQLRFVYFDSCDMGCLPYLGHFADVTKYVVGCPNWYDWYSILELDSFHNMKNGDLDELIAVIDDFAEQFNNSDALVEIGIYDPHYAILLWNCFVDHEYLIHISQECNIDTELAIHSFCSTQTYC